MVTVETCRDEMVKLFTQVLQDCSEQVLKVHHRNIIVEMVIMITSYLGDNCYQLTMQIIF